MEDKLISVISSGYTPRLAYEKAVYEDKICPSYYYQYQKTYSDDFKNISIENINSNQLLTDNEKYKEYYIDKIINENKEKLLKKDKKNENLYCVKIGILEYHIAKLEFKNFNEPNFKGYILTDEYGQIEKANITFKGIKQILDKKIKDEGLYYTIYGSLEDHPLGNLPRILETVVELEKSRIKYNRSDSRIIKEYNLYWFFGWQKRDRHKKKK